MDTQIFISYRRQNGEFLGKILYDELTRNGYSVFFDIESMRSGRFNEQLYEKIEKSDDFLLILTPNCLDRCKNSDDWVRKEIEHAEKCGKNIIPILTRGFKFPESLPESMKDLHFYQGVEATAGGLEYAMARLECLMNTNNKKQDNEKMEENMDIQKIISPEAVMWRKGVLQTDFNRYDSLAEEPAPVPPPSGNKTVLKYWAYDAKAEDHYRIYKKMPLKKGDIVSVSIVSFDNNCDVYANLMAYSEKTQTEYFCQPRKGISLNGKKWKTITYKIEEDCDFINITLEPKRDAVFNGHWCGMDGFIDSFEVVRRK